MRKIGLLILVMVMQLSAIAQGLQQVVPNKAQERKYEFDQVVPGSKTPFYTSLVKEGSAYLSAYSEQESRSMDNVEIKMLDSEESEVSIVQFFNKNGEIIVFGESSNSLGKDYYVAVMNNENDRTVYGKIVHSTTLSKKQVVEKEAFIFSENREVVGMKYIVFDTKTKGRKAHIVTFTTPDEKGQESIIDLPIPKGVNEEVNFSVYFLVETGFIAVYNEELNGKEVSVVKSFDIKGVPGKQNYILSGELALQGCLLTKGKNEQEVVISGYVLGEGDDQSIIRELYLGFLDTESMEIERKSMVPVYEEVRVINNSEFTGQMKSPVELTLNYKIKDVYFLESEFSIVIAENLSQNLSDSGEVQDYFDDLLMVCIDMNGKLVWASVVTNRQTNLNYQPKANDVANKLNYWESQSFFMEERLNILIKRPNFDGKMDVVPGSQFLNLWFSVNLTDGSMSETEGFELYHRNANELYIEKYREFNGELK
ncbi:MAG: hypothetical protein ACI85Q_000088 [Salibacteraceae bacterium]|jgi:hypothetical protein